MEAQTAACAGRSSLLGKLIVEPQAVGWLPRRITPCGGVFLAITGAFF
jgi:hypothetical protein